LGYALCITEKPSVARDIAKVIGAGNRKEGYFEGSGYLVTWAIGHLVGIAEPLDYGYVPQNEMYGQRKQEALDQLPLIPEKFILKIYEKTAAQFEIIKNLMHRSDVDYIIDCGDMGAEGHILQWFIREMTGNTKPVKRFCATSMTDEAIRHAMNNLRPIEDFENIVKGEFCKKKADWMLGMSISRAQTLVHGSNIDVGRVQSPTLYFIVKRHLDVENFKVTDYYTMEAKLKEGFSVFWLRDSSGLFESSAKDSEGRVIDKISLDAAVQKINQHSKGEVKEVEIQKKATNRPQLYDITELQRDANKKYGYSAAQTLAAAQSLYATHKVLSYPRTDSKFLTSDWQGLLVEIVQSIGTLPRYQVAAQNLIEKGLLIDKRIVDDTKVTDHHAIIPTEVIKGFDLSRLVPSEEEKKKDGLTTEMLNHILDLVLARVLTSLSQPYIYEHSKVEILFADGFVFAASGSRPISEGWRAVQRELLGEDETDEEVSSEQIFPLLEKGQEVHIDSCLVLSKKTTPPKLHTEATLLTAMENAGANVEGGKILKGKGIGTQATRAEIIKKLFDKGYVETVSKIKTKYIKPTQKGIAIIKVLPPELYSPQMTADWENKIALIAEGKATEDDFMQPFMEFIRQKTHEIKNSQPDSSFERVRETFGKCLWCSNDIHRFEQKNDKGKIERIRYYCSEKCGFSLYTNDNVFQIRLGRNATDAEARKMIEKGYVNISAKNKKTNVKESGKFSFKERISNGIKYCNVQHERI